MAETRRDRRPAMTPVGSLVDVVVLGAGVTGLTTAVQLAEHGSRVEVWSDQPPRATTSAAAGAIWGPYLTEPRRLIRSWSMTSLHKFTHLATQPHTGVAMVSGIEAARTPALPPDWADMLPDFALCPADQLPSGFVSGWRYTAPIIDMPVYLTYLQHRFHEAGGILRSRKVSALVDGFERSNTVVNCTGYSARKLARDETLTAVRGDLLTVANPGIDTFFTEETGDSPNLVHIYPQGAHLILGGTALEHNDSRSPVPGIAQAILERCAAIEPRLSQSTILEHRIGLRPTRPEVRLSPERIDHDRLMIHNYGHGGSGVTLSWGCASLIRDMLYDPAHAA